MEIRNIEELITPLLINTKYKSHKLQKFLQVGENYGSTILKLVVYCEDDQGRVEEYHCIAKLVPQNAYVQKVFNTSVTFKKEIRMYDTIIPTLNTFGEENGIQELVPFFGKYIGSRVSLNPKSDDVDNDAALILKNLSYEGYIVCDRFIGFDKNTTELLLKALATMHATTIAFKIKKPEEFKKDFMPHFRGCVAWDYDDVTLKKYQDQYASALKKDNCEHLVDRVVQCMRKAGNYYGSEPREPFATMIHQDLWTNNVLVKFIDGKPTSCKFIDFQVMNYGNPASDVLFLIYSSCQTELLYLIDDFIKIYFDQFTHTLKALHTDVSRFTLEEFQKEVDIAAKDFTFVHIIFMLAPIYTLRGKAKDITEMTGHEDTFVPDEDLHENFYRKLSAVVKEFARKEWI